MWKQLVNPNPATEYYAGYCLGFTQRVYNAPGRYNTAWEAWEAVPDKHQTRDIPQNVSVPIWFDHYGTYEGVYGRYGHVCAWIPGVGFLNNPGSGFGQKILPTLEATERFNNAKYVGWSESINGLKIVTYTQDTSEKSENTIMYIRNKITGQIGLFGGDVADGIHIFSSIDEYNAWRGIVIAFNTTVPAQFQKFVPAEITNTAAMLNVDQVGWDVAVQVHSR